MRTVRRTRGACVPTAVSTAESDDSGHEIHEVA